MSELAKWYVVHTYSGYENSVAANILKAAENRKMQDLIQEVNIPMETVKEITDSGEKTVERKVFPGYVLVKMVLTDESWQGRSLQVLPQRIPPLRPRRLTRSMRCSRPCRACCSRGTACSSKRRTACSLSASFRR